MAKTRDINEALDKYKSEFNEFFSLKDDGDSAIVRFLVGSQLVPEEDWFVCWNVQIGGKKRWLQSTEDETDPFIQAGRRPVVKLFLQVQDQSDPEKIKTWERGKNMIPDILALIKENGPLCNRLYEVVRKGAAGDEKTKYDFVPLDEDGTEYEDIADLKQPLLGPDGFVLQKSVEDMRAIRDGRYVHTRTVNNDTPAPQEHYSDPAARASLEQSAPPERRERGNYDEVF